MVCVCGEKAWHEAGKRWEDACERTGIQANVKRVYDDNTEKQLHYPSPSSAPTHMMLNTCIKSKNY